MPSATLTLTKPQKVDHIPEPPRGRSRLSRTRQQTISYRNPPESQVAVPALSNPIGNRAILAEVRAPLPPNRSANPNQIQNLNPNLNPNPVAQPHIGSAARANPLEVHFGSGGGMGGVTPSTGSGMSIPHNSGIIVASTSTKPIAVERGRGWTMSRGNAGGKSVARMDAFTWLSNVKVGGRRESSSGAASGADSTGGNSRMNSRSRVSSGLDLAGQVQVQEVNLQRQGQGQSQSQEGSRRRRSVSRARGSEDKREREGENQPLQDEYVVFWFFWVRKMC